MKGKSQFLRWWPYYLTDWNHFRGDASRGCAESICEVFDTALPLVTEKMR